MFALNKKIISLFIAAVSACVPAAAQNINTPNKQGPLGTQVNTYTGNLYIPRTDFQIPGRGFDMNIAFYYNSFNAGLNKGWGNGWSFAYDIRYSTDTANNKILTWGDGREDVYTVAGSGFKSPSGFFDTLTAPQAGKLLLSSPDGVKFYFDNATHKRITKLQDANSNVISFNYTDTLLTSMVNSAGQTISFAYNISGNLTAVTDAITSPSRTYTYTYDGHGDLTQVTDPLGGKDKYTYLVNGPMKTLADKNSNTIDIIYYGDLMVSELIGCNKRMSFSYDTTTNITVVTDYLDGNNLVTKYGYKSSNGNTWLTSLTGNCCGYNKAFEYDATGNKIKETDANGNVYNYTYDDRGNMLTVKDPQNRVYTYTYTTAYNNIASFTDAKGIKYMLDYDSKGNLTKLSAPASVVYAATYNANGDLQTVTDTKGFTYTYTYNAFGLPSTVTGPEGLNIAFSVNGRGNLLSYKDNNGNTYNAEFDVLDRIKKLTDPLNNFIQLGYDAKGNIISLVNENNETAAAAYDASNRLVKYTDPTGKATQLSYDKADNLTAVKNPAGYFSTMAYDARNRLQSMTDAMNNTGNLSYDANGNLTSIILPSGEQFSIAYDNVNRLTGISDQTGTLGSFVYDKNNNVISGINGTGAASTLEYDSLDRISKVTDPLGFATAYTYDKSGNVTSVKDRNGFTRSYTYDDRNRLKTYTDNNSAVITISYDAQGNVTSLKDQNNNTTSYIYDVLNRVSRVNYADSRFVEFTYNAKGNLTARKLTDGSMITYQYDTLNRVRAKTLPDGRVFTYQYDVLGRVAAATNENGTVAFTYDPLNRILSESFDGRTVRYAYNTAGRTQTVIYPDSTVITKNFDERNRLLSVTKNNVVIAGYEYNNEGQLTKKKYGNNVETNYQYDFANRLTNIFSGAGNIQNSNISYDKERNKTATERLNDPAASEQLTYDNGHRLTNYKKGPTGSPVLQNTYTYDAAGNRITANLNGAAVTYTKDNMNRMTAISGGQNIAFTYDNNGNRTYDGVFYKTYDAEGRLIKDSSSVSNVLTYAYDAFGRRIKKNIAGSSYKYTFAGLAPIEERDAATGDVINRTVFTNFLTPVLNEKNNVPYYFHQGENNSVEAVTDVAGNIAERRSYDAYGKPTTYNGAGTQINGSVTGNRFGLNGHEYDSANGNYNFHFRSYSPATGTFNQKDPLGYYDGMNMYAYVGNNPANGLDILGLDDCTPKDKVTVETVPVPPTPVMFVIQVTLDEGGATGLVFSVADAVIQSKLKNFNVLKAIADANYATLGEAAYESSQLQKAGQTLAAVGSKNVGPLSKVLGVAGPALGAVDLGVKSYNYNNVINDPKSSYMDVVNAEADVASSGGYLIAGLGVLGSTNPVAIGAGIGLGALALGDALSTHITGKSIRQHAEKPVDWLYNHTVNNEAEYKNWLKTFGLEHSEFLQNIYYSGKGTTYLRTLHHQQNPAPGCPQNNDNGGPKKKRPIFPGSKDSVEVVQSKDPNAIIGPDGLGPSKYWVSVKDRLPYTILYENDKSASAPAKYIKISYPVDPKQDANTFYLGNFGFNNQTFAVPPNTPAYYQRLDCKDSLGLYVDVTAGLDVTTNSAFWEFQSIDPVTLLPPTDPLKGLLLLQDSSKPTYGHGFVNFSIKPKTTDVTLDTIHATADIMFDTNDTIPTNYAKNTIDAFAPSSHMNTLPASSNNPVALSWGGVDDTNGCGLSYYTLYVSTDGVNFNIMNTHITRTDTTFTGTPGTTYYFFVLATDSVGNTETLLPGHVTSTFIGAVVPVTLLSFRGSNHGKDNLLEWSTATEINTKDFKLERSLNNSSWSTITTVNAAGNSSTTRNYDYTDRNIDRLNSSVMYYRLKQSDVNGAYKYSNIVKLNYLQKDVALSLIYPNPTHDQITLVVGDKALVGTEALLYDAGGRVIEKIKITTASQPIQMGRYLSGTYILQLANKEAIKIIKL